MNLDSLPSLLAAIAAGQSPSYLYFWGHTPAGKGRVDKSCLSQWYPAPFEVDGVRYATAEHYMMARKAALFGDAEIERQVLVAPNPDAAKKLGRKVRSFDGTVWDGEREAIVFAGSLAKFSQNPALGEFLLATGDQVLVEASPVDRIWGVGLAAKDPAIQSPARWNGLNLLGFALMKARAVLAARGR